VKKPEECTSVHEIYPIIQAYEARRDELRANCKHVSSTPKMYMWRVGSFNPYLICDECDALVHGITEEQSKAVWEEWSKGGSPGFQVVTTKEEKV
jgi:hypothetical protein